jgi:hypothetical protein
MTFPAQGFRIEALVRTVPALFRFAAGASFCMAASTALLAHAEFSTANPLVARSVSGQFIVRSGDLSSRLFNLRDFEVNTNFVRLDPALLAVAAERFKALLWRQLGLQPDSPWRGKIYLNLQPAHSPDDEVTIASDYQLHTWDYHVTLPDILTRTRYARALSAVLLLELANRDNSAGNGSAEIPSWLVDGLAQEILDEGAAKVILSVPPGSANHLLQSFLNEKQHGLDAVASARATLQDIPALTFDQLSWPTDEQLNGDEGGVYLASAQLFVHELLGLPNGQKKVGVFLARLGGCRNWQTAFFLVYQDDFRRSLEVEKWWSLRAIDFAAHNSSSQWTAADSSDRLASLLSVPVEVRGSSNSLPAHGRISLQAALLDFGPAQRDDVVSTILRNLELAQFRLASPFAVLAAGYRNTLADYLGESDRPQVSLVNKSEPAARRATVTDTLRKLDALDLRRRDLIARMNFRFVPRNAHYTLP